jgi:Pup amidohydrolase
LLYRSCGYRRVRHDTLGFLLSRPILTGAGALDPITGVFGLSEKGPAMRRLVRMTGLPIDRSVFDIGHLIKAVFSITNFELRPLGRLFRQRQRLQLGLSDSNLAQTAEYLKVATTTLVIDMAEAGALRQLPRVRRPIQALRRLIADPDLRVKVRCSDGIDRSALELQRLYLERARTFVADSATPSLEAKEVVRSWAEILDALEHEPAGLFGRIDWLSKRSLLETAGADLGPDVRMTIALKYHELGVGYFAQLEREGLAPTLVDPEEATHAMTHPPQASRARRRSQLVRALAAEGVRAVVSWDRVEIRREGERRQVIRLDDHR